MGRIYRRGRTFHAYWTDAGGRAHRDSLHTADRDVARVRLRQLELAATDPAAYSGHTLGTALTNLESAMRGAPAGTRSSYEQKGRHLVRVLGADVALASLTRDRLVEYVEVRLEERAHPSTVHKEMVVLRRALKEAAQRGLWRGSIGDVVPKIKASYRPRETWLSREHAAALIAALAPKADDSARRASVLRDRQLWVALALYAGLRASEVENLRWSQVDGEDGWLRAPGTKTTGAWRMIPLAPELAELLAAAAITDRDLKPDNCAVSPWPSVRRDLRRAYDRALRGGKNRVRLPKGQKQPPYPKLTPNDLRRTFASWLVQAGTPLLVVARLLGHSSTRMVERVYGHLSTASYKDAIARTFGCAAGVQHTPSPVAQSGAHGTSPIAQIEAFSVEDAVPRAGIEPATRGFSVPDASGPKVADVLRFPTPAAWSRAAGVKR